MSQMLAYTLQSGLSQRGHSLQTLTASSKKLPFLPLKKNKINKFCKNLRMSPKQGPSQQASWLVQSSVNRFLHPPSPRLLTVDGLERGTENPENKIRSRAPWDLLHKRKVAIMMTGQQQRHNGEWRLSKSDFHFRFGRVCRSSRHVDLFNRLSPAPIQEVGLSVLFQWDGIYYYVILFGIYYGIYYYVKLYGIYYGIYYQFILYRAHILL